MRSNASPRGSTGRAAGAALVLLAMAAAPVGPAASAGAGAVAGHVRITKNGGPKGDRSQVVVYLEGVPEPARGAGAPAGAATKIRQRDNTFWPGLVVVRRGESVEFPNEDKVFHNVFSVSEAAKFDLGLYKSGTSKVVTFREPGVVNVYCNIHPEMVAEILVVDTSHYAITAADGSFRIPGVPPGKYGIVAWQAHGEPRRGAVTVASGATAEVSFDLEEVEVSRRHLRKDNTPYGRYK
jgi:plastocyanin